MGQKRVAQSAPKDQFFTALGLVKGEQAAETLLKKMLDEAAAGRKRLSQNPESLSPQLRADPDITTPYIYSEITVTAKHKEILNIYRLASEATKPWYNKGRFFQGPNEENWVIEWVLHHSFRYVDPHNQRNRAARESAQARAAAENNDRVENNHQTSTGKFSVLFLQAFHEDRSFLIDHDFIALLESVRVLCVTPAADSVVQARDKACENTGIQCEMSDTGPLPKFSAEIIAAFVHNNYVTVVEDSEIANVRRLLRYNAMMAIRLH